MKDEIVYKSIFRDKKDLREDKQDQLQKIVESLKEIKEKLNGDNLLEAEGEEVEVNDIANIVDKVEDLVVDAIKTLGATNEVTTELLGTVGTIEDIKDEEEMIAAIEASSQEADEIQEGFDPVYDVAGNVINQSFDDYEDEMMIDEPMEMDYVDDYGMYESKFKSRSTSKVKKFKKDKY